MKRYFITDCFSCSSSSSSSSGCPFEYMYKCMCANSDHSQYCQFNWLWKSSREFFDHLPIWNSKCFHGEPAFTCLFVLLIWTWVSLYDSEKNQDFDLLRAFNFLHWLTKTETGLSAGVKPDHQRAICNSIPTSDNFQPLFNFWTVCRSRVRAMLAWATTCVHWKIQRSIIMQRVTSRRQVHCLGCCFTHGDVPSWTSHWDSFQTGQQHKTVYSSLNGLPALCAC